jgi:hypothetical protein
MTWRSQVFNEVITWLLGLTLLGFKGDLFNPEQKYKVGWLGCIDFTVYIVVHLGYNLCKFLNNTIVNKVKNCLAKRKRDKLMKAKLKA